MHISAGIVPAVCGVIWNSLMEECWLEGNSSGFQEAMKLPLLLGSHGWQTHCHPGTSKTRFFNYKGHLLHRPPGHWGCKLPLQGGGHGGIWVQRQWGIFASSALCHALRTLIICQKMHFSFSHPLSHSLCFPRINKKRKENQHIQSIFQFIEMDGWNVLIAIELALQAFSYVLLIKNNSQNFSFLLFRFSFAPQQRWLAKWVGW